MQKISANNMYSYSVIIPAFNEIQNIEFITKAVLDAFETNGINGEVLIVYDNSSDKTIQAIEKMHALYPQLRLIVRESDHGLSQSVAEGLQKADADIIQVIDADFSHQVDLIPKFYTAIHDEGFDVCIGTRSKNSSHIPLITRLFCKLFFPEVTDPLCYCFALKKEVITSVKLNPNVYSIFLEILGKGTWHSFKETPLTLMKETVHRHPIPLRQFFDIGLNALINHETSVWREMKKILKFVCVGISGVFVNTGLLFILTEYAGLFYIASSLIAIESSIITNFTLNDFWTFHGGSTHNFSQKWKRFISYQTICIVGLLINVTILTLLTQFAGLWYIYSNIIAIFCVFAWDFLVNRNITWKGKKQ